FQELSEIMRGLSIPGELNPRSIDVITSFGERLSNIVVAKAFNAVHTDSRRFIVTDDHHTQAHPRFDLTFERLKNLPAGEVIVMGGFISATEQGVTTTLGRGGSDYSASIIGAGIGAEEILIWTDVDGMLTADPRVFK